MSSGWYGLGYAFGYYQKAKKAREDYAAVSINPNCHKGAFQAPPPILIVDLLLIASLFAYKFF